MHPLLSHEEINALLNETEKSFIEPPIKLTIDTGKQYIILYNSFDLERNSSIELNLKLGMPYLVWYKNEAVACGKLIAIEGRLVLKVSSLVDSDHCRIVE